MLVTSLDTKGAEQMPNEIAQKKAVKISEWLGVKPEYDEEDRTGCWVLNNDLLWIRGKGIELECAKWEDGLIKWLSSLEGEVAMMNKLAKNGMSLSVHPPRLGDYYFKVGIYTLYSRVSLNFSNEAPTRNAALQQAILAMLEEK